MLLCFQARPKTQRRVLVRRLVTSLCVPTLLAVVGCASTADAPIRVERTAPVSAPSATSATVKPFAPGVAIDWQRRAVEVQGRVVLREGPIELFACSPRTREYESIIVVDAQPLHIYQAMGLMGLEPGSPIRFDPKRDRWLPPKGQALRLRVRYRRESKVHTVPVNQWLSLNDTGSAPDRVPWVFAGSRTGEDGRFGADRDGTVIAVVDFETALISVGAVHSADNESLWLSARTAAIPPLGTACTLLIAARGGGER